MQRLCELFPNNYNSQGGRGFDQTVISNFAPSRLVGDPIFSTKYCTSRVLYRSRTITRSTCNAAALLESNCGATTVVKVSSFELVIGTRRKASRSRIFYFFGNMKKYETWILQIGE